MRERERERERQRQRQRQREIAGIKGLKTANSIYTYDSSKATHNFFCCTAMLPGKADSVVIPRRRFRTKWVGIPTFVS